MGYSFAGGQPIGIIACQEAAGNSATLSPCNIVPPIANEFVAAGGTFEFADDIWIIAAQVWGDTADMSRVTLDSSAFSGSRILMDIRENMPAETSTGSAHGFHDFRNRPIKIPGGDIPEVNWTEGASTNVEPHMVLFYTWKQPDFTRKPQIKHMMEPSAVMTVGLTQSATVAVTWTRSTNIMGPANSDAIPFIEKAQYTICGMRTTGSATHTATVLEIQGMPTYQGIAGPSTAINVQENPVFDPFEVNPLTVDGKTLNRATINSIDVAGSEAPVIFFDIRRQS